MHMLTTNGGVAYYNKGQYDAAISDCNNAIEINPKYALAYYNRENPGYTTPQ